MSNFSCDSFEQIEKNLEKLFVPKYYPGFILSIYENGNETYYIKKGYDDIFKKTEYKRNSNKSITIKDLFTHTAGFTYGFQGQSKIDEQYITNGINSVVDSE